MWVESEEPINTVGQGESELRRADWACWVGLRFSGGGGDAERHGRAALLLRHNGDEQGVVLTHRPPPLVRSSLPRSPPRGRVLAATTIAVRSEPSAEPKGWSAVTSRLSGRTDNEIKNYQNYRNTHVRKRLLRIGIDPVTHSPRLDLLDLSSILTSSLCSNNNTSQLLNLSSLMGLASQPFLNPELLNPATTLLAFKQQNPNLPQQNLQETQLYNQIVPTLQHNNVTGDHQFQNQAQEVPSSTTTTKNVASASTSNLDQTQYLMQPNYVTSNTMQQTFFHAMSSPTIHHQLGNSSFESMHNDCNKSFCFDSVKSSPLSGSTPLDSSSNFINSSNEDKRESYCSSLLKFDIPESFDISEFL